MSADPAKPVEGVDGGNAARRLPSVDALARTVEARHPELSRDRRALVEAVRSVVAGARTAISGGADVPALETLAERAITTFRESQLPAPRRVLNATGVIINTNLGRAPLSDAAIRAVADVARGYSNLEYDLITGERGSRQSHVRADLCLLTGAEDAIVVNNNAAAVLVTLAALAAGREVVVSRGELVEIGGGFRVPDVLRQSGARLIEVGTTNRTRAADFEAAISPETSLLLAVHQSNFRIVGFTEAPDIRELAELAHAHGLALVHDVGSGSPASVEPWGLAHEPSPAESVARGADVVCFSGDKLLGGPQAGIIVGHMGLLQRIARHPLMRAVRIDKLSLAALSATLGAHHAGRATEEVPVWRMMAAPLSELRRRAERWVVEVRALGASAEVVAGSSTVGGGSLPGETLPTALCAIGAATAGNGRQAKPRASAHSLDPARLAARLRESDPPVIGRVNRGQLLLDPRTIDPAEDDTLLAALRSALS